MSLGLGLLLAALAGLIVWQVDKHAKWAAFRKASTWVLAILVLLVVALGAYVSLENFSGEREQDARVAQLKERGVEKYWGLKPGMTEREVLYAKGEPRSRAPAQWLYGAEYDPHTYAVIWNPDKRVETIQCFGSGRGCEKILGISLGATEAMVRSMLGEPSRPPEISDDGLKGMAYGTKEKGQVILFLQKDEVVQIVVGRP